MTLRAPDQAAFHSAQKTMDEARSATASVVVGARTKQQQWDALIWVAVIFTGATMLLFTLAPRLIDALWPAAAEDRAAAVLHKSRWEAGVELMASGDPARWRQLVDADGFQHDTAQVVAACRNRANTAARPVNCSIKIAPAKKASEPLSSQ